MASEAVAALTALLTERKERSGLSYELLGRKVHLSRSTVHRYCTGRSVPATFAPIEAIATACGANREELAKLYRLWERADLGDAVIPDTVIRHADAPADTPTSPDRRRPLANLALVAVLGVVLLAGGAMATPTDRQVPAAIQASMWTNAPRTLDPEFVGVTANSNTGQMPSFEVGSVRLWNTRTRWQNLEPARGRYDWNTLERLVTGARGAGLPVTLTFGGTPSWASPNSPKSVYTDDSRSGPPDDLADWERFVRTVAEQYRGRIDAYELWDMANHQDFFSGSTAQLVEMTRRASQVLKSVDPAVTVVCPSMGELWDPVAFDKLRQFAKLGGYDHCDAGAVKLAPRNDSDPPETMLPLANEIEKALHEAGAGIRLWSTGSAYDVNRQRPVDADRGAQHAVRFFLSGLYAQYRRMYFYNWGSAKIPIVLQPVGGPHTKAARHVERLHRWLAGSRIHSCGQGRPAGLPDDLWQCRFDQGGRTFLIWWTIDRSARIPAANGTTSVEQLDGTSAPVTPGADVTVTGSPVLLRLA
ncbi:cobalamin ABC transporter substrate-binding protein [Amycolatopsis sp. WAC 01376]|uniref:helix-turn-helix domain-containing protein n=1 Tax=Amycolatopsis sp. WAC 01376 TaxID=2203195 RepID=UPI000F7AEDF3|nr:helix-turn-helix domain-containing protein [Amycolatopsis sp. WAC 01376]RSM53112.1 cobalamin ABC transporter substrate-binding protein [Amycolatopsis sp. WAC 01376]